MFNFFLRKFTQLKKLFKCFLVPFYKTSLLPTVAIEILLIIPFQYPDLNIYYRTLELGSFICLPISSILSALSFGRFYFILKLFKHLTKWTSTKAEYTWYLFIKNLILNKNRKKSFNAKKHFIISSKIKILLEIHKKLLILFLTLTNTNKIKLKKKTTTKKI